ncbi:MAG: hypothetical protein B6D59_05440 [Campylobacteraceae bacterium 4484_4]|nr:MAG: hypothetical protein B6D59_05440 [Campylobacteraceae bacterium 4484_4]
MQKKILPLIVGGLLVQLPLFAMDMAKVNKLAEEIKAQIHGSKHTNTPTPQEQTEASPAAAVSVAETMAAATSSGGTISEESLSYRNTNLYSEDQTVPPPVSYTKAAPGTAKTFQRSFENAPPMIPHSVEGLLPITKSNKPCSSGRSYTDCQKQVYTGFQIRKCRQKVKPPRYAQRGRRGTVTMDIQRRDLFRSLSTPFTGKEISTEPIRPPYNSNPALFEQECTTCEEKPCIASCDEDIIIALEDGTVALDFSKRGCTYCDDCAKACKKGVLTLTEEPLLIRANVTLDMTKCIAWHNVICRSCADVCYDRAIKFLGMLRPEIDYENCTNCGFCIGVCPTQAISAEASKETT